MPLNNNSPSSSSEVLLSDITLGGDNAVMADVDVANYSNYKILFDGYVSGASGLRLQFNADTGNNYSYHKIYGVTATTTTDGANSQVSCEIFTITTTDRCLGVIYICNTAAGMPKSITGTFCKSNNYTAVTGGTWDNAVNLITHIKAFSSAGNMKAGSRMRIYGVV